MYRAVIRPFSMQTFLCSCQLVTDWGNLFSFECSKEQQENCLFRDDFFLTWFDYAWLFCSQWHCGRETDSIFKRQEVLRKLKEHQEHVLAFAERALYMDDDYTLLTCRKEVGSLRPRPWCVIGCDEWCFWSAHRFLFLTYMPIQDPAAAADPFMLLYSADHFHDRDGTSV